MARITDERQWVERDDNYPHYPLGQYGDGPN